MHVSIFIIRSPNNNPGLAKAIAALVSRGVHCSLDNTSLGRNICTAKLNHGGTVLVQWSGSGWEAGYVLRTSSRAYIT